MRFIAVTLIAGLVSACTATRLNTPNMESGNGSSRDTLTECRPAASDTSDDSAACASEAVRPSDNFGASATTDASAWPSESCTASRFVSTRRACATSERCSITERRSALTE